MTKGKASFKSPEDIYGDLFYDVHRSGIFEDGKNFADATAKMHPDIILKTYKNEHQKPDFSLKSFVHTYFDIPYIEEKPLSADFQPIESHLSQLWKELKRAPDKVKKNRTSKIPLPYSYIVPGGRFNEIYYWDSYFTMLGLRRSGHIELITNMINNFKFLIDTLGFIPNGNRTYFVSRSQPPFYSLMVKLLIEEKGADLIPEYLASLVKEYNFWMAGIQNLEDVNAPNKRVVKLEKDRLLNRYYDELDTPRVEMFRDDWELKEFDANLHQSIYREIRAACESGWDFSGRWFEDGQDISTIHSLDLCPIDLNCLLWHLEKLISECYGKLEKNELSLNYGIIAHNRKKAINDLFWSDDDGFFMDYNWKTKTCSDKVTLAGIYPLFFQLATQEQANSCAEVIQKVFLKPGGVVTTPYHTGQQWDAPNGWAPLQFITIKGLLHYGFKELAREIADRWIRLNRKIYSETGKMLEKYNVENINIKGGGGEYPVQDGFGWTNGVYQELMAM